MDTLLQEPAGADPSHISLAGIVPPGLVDPGNGLADTVCAAIAARQNVSPKRLVDPGPDAAQVVRLFSAAAAAPDHGQILPWRFVIVPAGKRERLAQAFALALIDRSPGATPDQIEAAREKAYRAPLLALAVAKLAGNPEAGIPDVERLVSLGCAVQNLLLAAQAMGFGAGLASGQSMQSVHLRQLFRLHADERAICFVNVGTVAQRKPPRTRPAAHEVVIEL